jgi:predicted nucleotidyltransferase
MKTISVGLLQQAVERLVKEFQPEAIYLFGSHAWGTPTEDSDVDLYVILRESSEPPLKRAQRGHCSLIGLPFPKDVLVRTRAEVEDARSIRSSVANSILTKGKLLYG